MTKDTLKQYRCLCREISVLQSELKFADPPSSSLPSDTQRRLLDHQLLRANQLRDSIETFIDSVPDSEIRLILRLRFLKGLTWQRIAFLIHHYDEQYPRKKIDKFFRLYENNRSPLLK